MYICQHNYDIFFFDISFMTMKFRIPLYAAFAAVLASCSGSDDHTPLLQPDLPAAGKSRVCSITHEGSLPNVYNWTLTYDATRLVAAEGNLVGDMQNKYRSAFYYGPSGVTIANSEGPKMEATFNIDGNIVQLMVNKDVYHFTYADGRLITWDKTVRDMNFGGDVSSASGRLAYQDGNLVSIEYIENEGAPTFYTLTPSAIPNRNGLLPALISQQMGCFGFEHLYYGGMLGKPSTHLISNVKVDSSRGEEFDYEISYAYSSAPLTGDITLCNISYENNKAAAVIYKY